VVLGVVVRGVVTDDGVLTVADGDMVLTGTEAGDTAECNGIGAVCAGLTLRIRMDWASTNEHVQASKANRGPTTNLVRRMRAFMAISSKQRTQEDLVQKSRPALLPADLAKRSIADFR
jgi:hypothetical protein